MISTVRPVRWAALFALPLPACTVEVGGNSPFADSPQPDAAATIDDATIQDAGAEPTDDGAAPPMEASTEEDAAASDGALEDADVGPLQDVRPAPPDADAPDAADAAPPDAAPPDAAPPPAPCVPQLALLVRDFQSGHPDFPKVTVSTDGLIAEQLGSDRTPVRAQRGLLTGPHAFEQWFRDTPGVNQRVELALTVDEPSPGRFVLDRTPFFPIDGQGFGNGPTRLAFLPGNAQGAGAAHNYLFTTEGHGRFVYRGGETLTFTSNDDVWVFINDRLALDLGATYRVEGATVMLDTVASRLDLEKGEVYSLDIFHAARSLADSRYRLDTTVELACLEGD